MWMVEIPSTWRHDEMDTHFFSLKADAEYFAKLHGVGDAVYEVVADTSDDMEFIGNYILGGRKEVTEWHMQQEVYNVKRTTVTEEVRRLTDGPLHNAKLFDIKVELDWNALKGDGTRAIITYRAPMTADMAVEEARKAITEYKENKNA